MASCRGISPLSAAGIAHPVELQAGRRRPWVSPRRVAESAADVTAAVSWARSRDAELRRRSGRSGRLYDRLGAAQPQPAGGHSPSPSPRQPAEAGAPWGAVRDAELRRRNRAYSSSSSSPRFRSDPFQAPQDAVPRSTLSGEPPVRRPPLPQRRSAGSPSWASWASWASPPADRGRSLSGESIPGERSGSAPVAPVRLTALEVLAETRVLLYKVGSAAQTSLSHGSSAWETPPRPAEPPQRSSPPEQSVFWSDQPLVAPPPQPGRSGGDGAGGPRPRPTPVPPPAAAEPQEPSPMQLLREEIAQARAELAATAAYAAQAAAEAAARANSPAPDVVG
eukprot:TRINITY_DN35391_c0_g1_i1.p2 TRINITY_DN35391_c0_g1~~TRINITY_DN35391_c0_g1_i1.p2  ORF type:complete len:336 (+),score=52.03 TRINITY_DN35391_c0_g1_i1:112-1119(+)